MDIQYGGNMVSCCISHDRIIIIIKWAPGGSGSCSYFYLYKFMCTDTYRNKFEPQVRLLY